MSPVPQKIESIANVSFDISFPNIVSPAQQIQMALETPSQVHFVTITGEYCYGKKLSAGMVYITVPDISGMYIIELVFSDGLRLTQPFIVQ